MMRSSPLIIQEIFGWQGHSLQHILLLEKRDDSLGIDDWGVRDAVIYILADFVR